MSDALDTREMLAAAPLGRWEDDSPGCPLAVLPCLGTRYDRNGFPTYPRGFEGE